VILSAIARSLRQRGKVLLLSAEAPEGDEPSLPELLRTEIIVAFNDKMAIGAMESAAEALRDVIRDQRNKRDLARPLLWAAHLHAGA
jgi:DNA-binding LacI/PurR family transcriptional regulator